MWAKVASHLSQLYIDATVYVINRVFILAFGRPKIRPSPTQLEGLRWED